ncbi:hypothetical protein SASPL_104401 [Salvia splendens]|uniref:Uncharacterized protein n=1 Tax=Salvia splendens TaxID=180675 RepID=A0A8X8YJ66_SALSN|nr:hypothetical protein SASPL_104401 [Salvia splendens]
MGTSHRSGILRRSNDTARLLLTTIMGMVLGYFIGVSFPSVYLSKINLPSSLMTSLDMALNDDPHSSTSRSFPGNLATGSTPLTTKIYVPTNPRGAESLPPGIVVSESDLYLRRLWGDPNEDLERKPKYLVTFTVGFEQMNRIDATMKKFSEDFQILLFHYDGRASDWDQLEWSRRAIHVSAIKQTKWWYAKRFLHPDVVSAYDYIFIWDEDLGVEHFNADKYIQLVKKHGLEISQPGLEPNNGLTWQMTKRSGDREVHKDTEEKPGWCSDPRLPPCAAWVSSQYPPARSKPSHFRFALQPAHEKIGVVDSQWIVHQVIPSLGNQGQTVDGKAPWQGVCTREMQKRMEDFSGSAFYRRQGILFPAVE